MDSSVAHHHSTLLTGALGGGFPNLHPIQDLQNTGSGSGSSSPPLPGFGTPWSVQTSPSPPPPPGPNPIHQNQILNNSESEAGFYPQSPVHPAFFQGFPPVPAGRCPGGALQGPFTGPFSSAQMTGPPQSRRSPQGPQMQPPQAAFLQQRNHYNHHQPMVKQTPWGGHQGGGWGSGGVPWSREQRRAPGLGMAGSISHLSPMKKPFSSHVIAPPKFPRQADPLGPLGPKAWVEENGFRTGGNSLLPLQDRPRMFDSLNMRSLESSLIDIMHDPVKGRPLPLPGTQYLIVHMKNVLTAETSVFSLSSHAARSYGRRRGRSSLFPMEDGLLEDGPQGVLAPACFPPINTDSMERFSRKVFVGGLPPDIDEDEITSSFRRFGHLAVDWPHKAESKSYFPPKGYAFLLFQEESAVQALMEACLEDDGKLYLCVSSPTIKDKPVQIRPWNLSDSDFVMDGSQPLDPRKTIFVGGVPRPLRAIELAMIMDRLYGGVCYAGIDTDPELKYPKGAGRVAFSNQQSYIAAISARFVQLQHGDIDKRVEVKPYVLDDQLCDECGGARCGGKFAPFFCANVTCLQYYCEFCWANIHARAGRDFHKPLVKEGADRPRQLPFRWS
ncbi:unnamed protein product [Lota lota]